MLVNRFLLCAIFVGASPEIKNNSNTATACSKNFNTSLVVQAQDDNISSAKMLSAALTQNDNEGSFLGFFVNALSWISLTQPPVLIKNVIEAGMEYVSEDKRKFETLAQQVDKLTEQNEINQVLRAQNRALYDLINKQDIEITNLKHHVNTEITNLRRYVICLTSIVLICASILAYYKFYTLHQSPGNNWLSSLAFWSK